MNTKEYQAILRAAAEVLGGAMHIVNAEGITILYNEEMAKLEKTKISNVIGKPFREVFSNIPEEESTLMRALKERKSTRNQQQTYLNVYGKEISTVSSTIPIVVDGKVVAAMEVARDITEIKNMSDTILDLQRNLTEREKPEEGRGSEEGGSKGERGIRRYTFSDIIGENRKFEETVARAKKAANNDTSVMLYGETGVGKELFAQSIHYDGLRKKGPFLAQNCAAIPESLLEGMLFGTAKGGFTGAVDRAGLFEQANGGTLLLDEVSAMPIGLQGKLLRVLQEEYIYKGYMAALGDVYSTYYTEEEWNDMEEQTSGSYVGIGVLVQQDKNTGLVTVMKVFSGSPAKEAGMLAGDILAQVGEVDATTMDLDMLVQNHIRGEEGTDVDITVFRPDSNEYIDMTITRKTVAVETVEAKINGDIGYISVSEFDGVSAGQFRSAIDTLQERGMKKLIVDMRNNPGGDVNTVIDMTDYLLDQNQVIFSMESKQGKERVFKSTDNHKVDIPIVVLVNSNSASAAEIFTGALQDHGAATIVGTTTFGKGIVQSVFELDDGSALKITTERYFTPNGRNIHEQGIEPDVVVELEGGNDYALSSMKEEEDNQLQKAMEILMAK